MEEQLQCPSCGGEYLHHGKVEIYTREREDAPSRVLVVEANGDVVRGGDQSRNPSRRRQGIRISFWCEFCEAKPELTIAQHKGTTLTKWRV